MKVFKELGKLICYMPKYYSNILGKIATIEENYNKIYAYSGCSKKELGQCRELINYLGCTTARDNYDTIIRIQESVIRELLMGNKLDDTLDKINVIYS